MSLNLNSKYFYCKSRVDYSIGKVESNPSASNVESLREAREEYALCCIEIVEKMVAIAPGMLEMIDKLQVGDYND